LDGDALAEGASASSLFAGISRRSVKLTRLGKHKDGNGLYLQVTAAKSAIGKSWLLRFTSPVTHKERSMGLGSYPQVSLAEARLRGALWQAAVRGDRDGRASALGYRLGGIHARLPKRVRFQSARARGNPSQAS
jgi:hypothetical protein